MGTELDVVWNLTLAANIISANVQYGQIEDIKAVSGVRDVVLEALYEPCEVDEGEEYEPNMSTSPEQIGSPAAYAAGYTGAGTRIAIVDTGLDLDHISFSAAGFQYFLALQIIPGTAVKQIRFFQLFKIAVHRFVVKRPVF